MTWLPAGEEPALKRATDRQPTAPVIGFNEVRYQGAAPRPGESVTLKLPAEDGFRYLWVQAEGPRVRIENPDRPVTQVTLPESDAWDRAIVLHRFCHSSTAARVDRMTLAPPAEPGSHSRAGETTRGADSSRLPHASAGDEVIGLVGREVTLNGSRSGPSEELWYRWVQVEGPAVSDGRQDRAYYAFTPREPGTYRFALVVANAHGISEPSVIKVIVGQIAPPARLAVPPQAAAAVSGAGLAPSRAATGSAPAAEHGPRELLRLSIPGLADGPSVADSVADIFQSLAGRMPLYTTYEDLRREMVQRIEVVLPLDPTRREAWGQLVFQPLSAFTFQELLSLGIDLRSPTSAQMPLTSAQKDRLRAHMEVMAQAFRDASGSRLK